MSSTMAALFAAKFSSAERALQTKDLNARPHCSLTRSEAVLLAAYWTSFASALAIYYAENPIQLNLVRSVCERSCSWTLTLSSHGFFILSGRQEVKSFKQSLKNLRARLIRSHAGARLGLEIQVIEALKLDLQPARRRVRHTVAGADWPCPFLARGVTVPQRLRLLPHFCPAAQPPSTPRGVLVVACSPAVPPPSAPRVVVGGEVRLPPTNSRQRRIIEGVPCVKQQLFAVLKLIMRWKTRTSALSIAAIDLHDQI